MKKIVLAMLAVVSMSVLGGCASAKAPVTGFWYTDTQSSVSPTSNQVGNRVGEACSVSYLGLVAQGDSSIEAARRNGGITMVSSVDDHSTSILGFYAKYCTIVRGR